MHDDTDRPEEALLGSLLRWPESLDEVATFFRPEMFRLGADGPNGRIYRTLLDLHGQTPTDLVTLADHLHRRGWLADCGGYDGLVATWDLPVSSARVLDYARSIRDAFLWRQVASLGRDLLSEAQRPYQSPIDALAATERRLWVLTEVGADGAVVELAPQVDAVFDRIDSRTQDDNSFRGIPTGFDDLDDILSGLHAGELIVIAARPSVGKTAMALSLLRNLATRAGDPVPVFFASLEQSRVELAERLLASEAEVDSQFIRRGALDRPRLNALATAGRRLRLAPVLIDDAPRQSCLRIASNARRLVRRHGVRVVVVDYLSLIDPTDPSARRHEQVGEIARSLKCLARDLNLPVVALAQLNREVEHRTGGRPRLADLRESGEIEQHADTVLLLHRPENSSGPVIPIDVIVAKQRNGPVGEVVLEYNRPFVRFQNPRRF